MGLYASFDVVDDFGFIDETEDWGIIPDYSIGCDVFVETFIAIASDLVPVDTGYLQSTINADTDGGTFCECEATAEYAEYVEYGTWKMDAQPYFEIALEEALAVAEPLWARAEEEAIKEDEMLTEEEEMEWEMSARHDNGGMRGGGLNFSSPGAFIVSLLAMFIVAVVVTTIQALFGKDFSSHGHSSSRRRGGGGEGMVYIPDIIIT